MSEVDDVVEAVFGGSSSSDDSESSDCDTDVRGNERLSKQRTNRSTPSRGENPLTVHPAVLLSVKKFVLEFTAVTLEGLSAAAASSTGIQQSPTTPVHGDQHTSADVARFLSASLPLQHDRLRGCLSDAVDALRSNELSSARHSAGFLHDATWSYLLQFGSWPDVTWREAYGYAQCILLAWDFAAGCCEDSSGGIPGAGAEKHVDMRSAAKRLDMCYIMGVPPSSLRMLNAVLSRELASQSQQQAAQFWSTQSAGRYLAVPPSALTLSFDQPAKATAESHMPGSVIGHRIPVDVLEEPFVPVQRFISEFWEKRKPAFFPAALLPPAGSGARAKMLQNMVLGQVLPSARAAQSAYQEKSPPRSNSSSDNAAAKSDEPHKASEWANAFATWCDLDHLDRRFGLRRVPIEVYRDLRSGKVPIGKAPIATEQLASSKSMSEEVMSFSRFIRDFLHPCQLALERQYSARTCCEGDGCSTTECRSSSEVQLQDILRVAEMYDGPIAYLAQHSLFDQFSEMARDFQAPQFAAAVAKVASPTGQFTKVNTWLGTAGTVTPLHFDSYNNFFVQVVGFKLVRLYMPNETPNLYVQGSADVSSMGAQGNISAVDVEAPDLSVHPRFANATYRQMILRPGDMLFIPA